MSILVLKKQKQNKSEVKLVVDRVLWLCACVKLSECVQEAKSQRALTWELQGTHHNLTPFNSSILIGHVFLKKKSLTRKCIQWRYMHLERHWEGCLVLIALWSEEHIQHWKPEFSSSFHSHLDAPSPSLILCVPKSHLSQVALLF